jgi:E3 ubiquitin-protein ligase UBR4
MFQEEARALYLMEKYGHRWRQKSLRGIMPLRLTDAAWLKQVLFNPSSRLARQVACNMLESLCQVPVRKREVKVTMASFISMLGTLISI